MSVIRLGFRERLFLLVSLLMVLSMSTLAVFLLKNLKDNMANEFRERGALLAREFSQKIAEGVVIEDKRTLDRFILQLCSSRDLLYVCIYNQAGLILAQKVLVDNMDCGLLLESGPDDLVVSGETICEEQPKVVLNIGTPVRYDGERVGYVRLGLSLDRIGDEVRKRMMNASLLVALFICLGLVLCFYFSRSFSRPIRKLLEGVRKTSEGELSHHVTIRNDDEIGELAHAFNQMMDRLSASDEKIKRYAQELEGKVANRTAELRAANQRLEKDIARRRSVEKALRESKEKYQMLFSQLPAGVIHFDEAGSIRDFNNRFAEIMGTSSERIAGFDLLRSSGNGKLASAIQQSLDDGMGYFEGEYTSVFSGETLFLKVICHGISDEEGRFLAGVGLFEDLTGQKRSEAEKKQLRTQLQHAQKMEAIGTLAAGVAHDLNNLLSGLVTYPELLLLDLAGEHPLRKPILAIQESGLKAAAIVQDLLTLARRGVPVTEVVNLNTVLADFMGSPEYHKLQQYHPHVHLDMDIQENLPDVSGSSIHIFKCVMNLVSNAAEAMPDGGTIFLSTRSRFIDTPVRGYRDIRQGDYVIFSVTDTGIGMSPDEIGKIFEPFYTKKVMGRSGTGLGMAVVWGTVNDHKGYIDVNSVQGEGSRFDLYFPVTRKKNNHSEDAIVFDDMTGDESILIVDDVKQQRDILSLILRKLGYSVVALASGEEAVDYMKENSADLIILDMIMDPGIDGLETYERILKHHPHQKAIIASGFSETDRVKKAQRIGVGSYVKKPYSMEKIGLAVRSELDG